ncbi:MAG: hypothetical protein JWM33_306 [Caulobacteraceae bacterium]|nr:hypothetical protein [Caulobacteraceae bacterium]
MQVPDAALSALIGTAGFFGGRFFTQARQREERSAYGEIAALMVTLREAGLSLDDVQAFDGALRASVRKIKTAPPAQKLLKKVENEVENLNQTELNHRAAEGVAQADRDLEVVLQELFGLISPGEVASLQTVQTVWEDYREAETHLARTRYREGAVAGLMAATEYQQITQERIARLRAAVEERRTT